MECVEKRCQSLKGGCTRPRLLQTSVRDVWPSCLLAWLGLSAGRSATHRQAPDTRQRVAIFVLARAAIPLITVYICCGARNATVPVPATLRLAVLITSFVSQKEGINI